MGSRKRHPLRIPHSALGLRMQSAVRNAWWMRRWNESLFDLRMGARLGRGRAYAASGQVTSLLIDGPHVEAEVVGSRAAPYRVTLDFTALEAEAAERIASAMRLAPVVPARILTNDLPLCVEEMFRTEGVPLFPVAGRREDGAFDVEMRCSCPDWARPCKHLAAILHLLGAEIANRPSTLLLLRGFDMDLFWPPGDDPGGPPDMPSVEENRTPRIASGEPAPLVRRLGPVPFWRGVGGCVESLSKMYARMRRTAAEAADGRPVDL